MDQAYLCNCHSRSESILCKIFCINHAFNTKTSKGLILILRQHLKRTGRIYGETVQSPDRYLTFRMTFVECQYIPVLLKGAFRFFHCENNYQGFWASCQPPIVYFFLIFFSQFLHVIFNRIKPVHAKFFYWDF